MKIKIDLLKGAVSIGRHLPAVSERSAIGDILANWPARASEVSRD
jgi:hypothetical protein